MQKSLKGRTQWQCSRFLFMWHCQRFTSWMWGKHYLNAFSRCVRRGKQVNWRGKHIVMTNVFNYFRLVLHSTVPKMQLTIQSWALGLVTHYFHYAQVVPCVLSCQRNATQRNCQCPEYGACYSQIAGRLARTFLRNVEGDWEVELCVEGTDRHTNLPQSQFCWVLTHSPCRSFILFGAWSTLNVIPLLHICAGECIWGIAKTPTTFACIFEQSQVNLPLLRLLNSQVL